MKYVEIRNRISSAYGRCVKLSQHHFMILASKDLYDQRYAIRNWDASWHENACLFAELADCIFVCGQEQMQSE